MKPKAIEIVITAAIVIACALYFGSGSRKKTYDNRPFSGRDYVLEFPDTWEVTDKNTGDADIIATTSFKNKKDQVREYALVVLDNLADSMTDKEYLESGLVALKEKHGVPSYADFKKTRIGSCNGYYLRHYSLTRGVRIAIENYIVIDNQAAYLITFVYERSKKDDFSKIIDSIIGTFRLK